MPLAWNAWAVPWLLSAALHLSAAALVYAVGPRRLLNRTLAVTLLAGGTISTTYALGAMTTAEADSYAFAVMGQVAKLAVAPLYLVFLGAALRTPLVAPLRPRAVRLVLLAAAIALPLVVVFWPDLFVGGRTVRAAQTFSWAPTGLANAYDTFAAILFLYALAAAIDSYRRATPGTPARDRDRWFVLAFGTRDTAVAGFIILSGLFLRPGDVVYEIAFNVVFAGAVCAYLMLAVYGVLRWHLFDVDLKLKWTLTRGTLAAIFAGVFIVVTQLAQNGFAESLGWVWGGIAAGLLVFALVPLQRFSERLANAAMPRVDASEEYLAFRRAEVYKGALEEMLADGTISDKERLVLDGLRARLGLASVTVEAIERDVREAIAANA